MYNPRAWSRAGTYAFNNSPTIVTNVAITTINDGILILSGIIFLIKEITIFEHIKTTAVESPIPSPFIAELVTASVGHIPITCTKVGFSSMIPFLNIFAEFIFYILPPTYLKNY